jgi:hypothetical protein
MVADTHHFIEVPDTSFNFNEDLTDFSLYCSQWIWLLLAATHQSDANLRTMIYKLSTAPF